MNVKEEFLKFKTWLIEHKNNYQTILVEKPFCIEIKSDFVFNRDLILFKYNQIDSDFGQPFVKLCRGLVLDAHTFDPVVFPFVKFHNSGEIYADNIDWKSCWVGEKLDGSIIKIVRLGNNILIGTNSNIDAFKAPLAEQIGCTAKSFGDLVVNALVKEYQLNMDKIGKSTVNDEVVAPIKWLASLLDEGKTYMFELTSPFNKVVVTWHETRLNFLGVRDNKTFQETYFCEHELRNYFNTPKVFPLKNIDDCVKAAEQLDCNNEGFVVCDKNFNRVKVKSPTYVALHHMKNNGVLSYARGIEIVRGNELEEVLTYFQEFKPHLEEIKHRYDAKVAEINTAKEALDSFIAANGWDKQPWWIENGGQKRKDIAIWIMKNFPVPGLAFGLIDKKVESVEAWLSEVPADKMAQMLGFKQKEG